MPHIHTKLKLGRKLFASATVHKWKQLETMPRLIGFVL